jgi:acylphosphatase
LSASRVCRRCLVSGRVQGVFYRATVARRARELGVDGYACNLPDGRVEVLACGPPAAIESLMAALWAGSSASKVSDVAIEEVADPGESMRGFATR